MRVRYLSFGVSLVLSLLAIGCEGTTSSNMVYVDLPRSVKPVDSIWDTPTKPPKHDPSAPVWIEGIVTQVASNAKSFVFKMNVASLKVGQKISVYGRISTRKTFPRHMSDEPVSMLVAQAVVDESASGSSFKAKVVGTPEGSVRAGDKVMAMLLEKPKKRRR